MDTIPSQNTSTPPSAPLPPHIHNELPPDFFHIHGAEAGHTGDGHNYTEANRQFFDEKAVKFEEVPAFVETARRSAAAMLEAYKFEEEETRVLDYACGTGMLSRELASHTKSIVGVDISQVSVDHYNHRVHLQGILPEEMKAVCVELKGVEGELDGAKFDVVVCASSYHHFPSINETTRILASFLAPNGVLLVTDIMPPTPDPNPESTDPPKSVFPEGAHHMVPHLHGISEQMIKEAFEGAGLQEVSYKKVGEGQMMGVRMSWFVARGVKC